MVTITRVSNAWTLYVDGVSEDTATYSDNLDGGTSRVISLSTSTSSESFTGQIDQVSIHKGYGMTASEVTALYNDEVGAYYEPPPFSPTDIDGIQLWLDASQITGLTDGDTVATWSDESGESNDATQSTSSYQPTYQTNELNGEPIVRFDGTDDYLDLGTQINNLSNYTVFIVHKMISTSGDQVLLGSTDSAGNNKNSMFFFGYHPSLWGGFGDGVGATVSSYNSISASTNSIIATQKYTTGNSYVNGYKDGVESARTVILSNATSILTTTYSVAVGRYGGYAGYYANADIAEIIVYDTALSDTDREKVEEYLADKYDIDLNCLWLLALIRRKKKKKKWKLIKNNLKEVA